MIPRPEIPLPRLRLLIIPEYIGSDRITPHRLSHPDPLKPILPRDPRRMHPPADDLEWFTIEQKFMLPQRKLMPLLRITKTGSQHRQNKKNIFHSASLYNPILAITGSSREDKTRSLTRFAFTAGNRSSRLYPIVVPDATWTHCP